MKEQDIQDLFDVLSEYRNIINQQAQQLQQLQSTVETLSKDVSETRNVMFNSIINPAKEMLDGAARDDRFDQFMSANEGKFDKYGDSLKAIEGEDFDLANKAFEEYDSIEGEKPDAGMFGDEVVSLIEEQLDIIRRATNIPEGEDITVHQDGDTGEIEVESESGEASLDEGDTNADDVTIPGEEETAPAKEEPKNDMASLMAELEKEYK